MDKLLQRISQISRTSPWMWQVRLTDDEFRRLGAYVQSNPLKEPLATMCWLAHWYRREYSAASTACPIEVDASELWRHSGLNAEHFVYTTASGRRAWLQSIYVLGGMAFGLGNDERLLRRLCRIYHGEEDDITDIADEERSAAFVGSIVHRHALYHYLFHILNDKACPVDEQEQNFIKRIQEANNQELRQKFTLEWLVLRDETARSTRLRLRVRYRPELTGEGMHQYLRHDRLSLWGLQPHDTVRFSLRFMLGDEVLQEASPRNAFATFTNAGRDVGYLAWGNALWAEVRTLPCMPFDRIEIWGFADNNTEGGLVQTFLGFGDLSLCRDTSATGLWTSRSIAGRDKARAWWAEGCWHWEYIGQEEYRLHRYHNLFRYNDESFIFYRHDIEGKVRTVEYKQGATYRQWEDDAPPMYGFCRLRITLNSGKQEVIETTLLPSVDAKNPVVRDLTAHTITYRSMDGYLVTVRDDIEQAGLPEQGPCREILLENEEQEFHLFVWHPTMLRYAAGEDLLCLIRESHLLLPRIIAPRIHLHEYSAEGYAAYNNPEWPEWVSLVDYNETNVALCNNSRLLFWSYDTQEPPVADRSWSSRATLVAFQSLKTLPRDLIVSQGADYGIDPWDAPEHEATAFDCFSMAREHKVYYCCFRPLSEKEWDEKTFLKEIFNPLRAIRPQGLTDDDFIELARLKDELALNFNLPRQ